MKKILHFFLFVLFVTNGQAAINVADRNTTTIATAKGADLDNDLLIAVSSKMREKAGRQKIGFFKKLQLKVANKMLKKANKKASDMPQGIYIVLAIVGLGWLAMGILDDWNGNNWWICLLLYFLFWLPGLIYTLLKMGDYY